MLAFALRSDLARAQDSVRSVKEILSPPSARVVCHLDRHDPAQGRWYLSLLDEPGSLVRKTRAVFDSSGHALALLVAVSDSNPELGRRPVGQLVVVSFDPNSPSFHSIARGDSTGRVVTSPESPEARLPLSPEDKEQAERLARWIWNHRCVTPPS